MWRYAMNYLKDICCYLYILGAPVVIVLAAILTVCLAIRWAWHLLAP